MARRPPQLELGVPSHSAFQTGELKAAPLARPLGPDVHTSRVQETRQGDVNKAQSGGGGRCVNASGSYRMTVTGSGVERAGE